MYRTEAERVAASLMTFPVGSRKTYSYFGWMMGTLPPFAMVFKIIGETALYNRFSILLITLLAMAGLATGIVGYATGRFIPAAVGYASSFRLPNRALLLSMFGLAWGAVSGAIGGLFLFVVGSVFAGIVGGLVGAVALPVLATLHSLMRRGDVIEARHFLPIAFGITLTLCGLIAGL
ncbi:MAG TPA: hypothetical protein VMZ26_14735 [Pyrinomonadaceae bacterium]|nr:hypothetical protein [Pyrinomonadaceae bacterium]